MKSLKYRNFLYNTRMDNPCVILGNFDGVHLGHGLLINTAVNLYGQENVKVYYFDPHPKNIISPDTVPRILSPYEIKKRIFHNKYKVDFDTIPFTSDLSHMSGYEFVDFLIKHTGAKYIVVGGNYCFGHMAKYNAHDLYEMGKTLGIKVHIVNELIMNNNVVSSTVIRKCLKEGNIELANKYLGRVYSVIGKCIVGKRIGDTIGYPTCNMDIDSNIQYPASGVYATKLRILSSSTPDKLMPAMTNIGYNPTIAQGNQRGIETHIFDFDEDIYGEEVEVFFYKRLREERHYKSIDQLVSQLDVDKNMSQNYFEDLNYEDLFIL